MQSFIMLFFPPAIDRLFTVIHIAFHRRFNYCCYFCTTKDGLINNPYNKEAYCGSQEIESYGDEPPECGAI